MARDTKTLGDAGLRYDESNRLIIGQMPRITMHADKVQEMPDGSEEPIGNLRPIMDMQPTLIPFADLITALMEQNDKGLGVDFLGHVRVIPTNPDERILLNDVDV